MSRYTEKKNEFLRSWEWRELRYKVLNNRGRSCECCGAKPPEKVMHVDHIKPLSKYWQLRLKESNLQVLCEDCNIGKSNIDETDFRDKMVELTIPLLELMKTGNGGYTYKSLKLLGVETPPKKGWRKKLVGKLIKPSTAEKLMEISKKRNEAWREKQKKKMLAKSK